MNRVGGLLVEQVVDGVRDPLTENRAWVGSKKARYKDSSAMKYLSRFGTVIRRKRRGYWIEGEHGRWFPLDEALGLDRCCGFTPLMSYLLTSLGSSEAYARAGAKLSRCLGFSVSATAVQHNTEAVGKRLDTRPLKKIERSHQSESCDVMVVEVDGTPEFKSEKQHLRGRKGEPKTTHRIQGM